MIWIGRFLLLSGLLSLLFTDLAVRVRRVWPWRRDDHDPARDAALDAAYRWSVFVSSILLIETGAVLAGIALPPALLRLAIYILFGLWRFRRGAGKRSYRPPFPPT